MFCSIWDCGPGGVTQAGHGLQLLRKRKLCGASVFLSCGFPVCPLYAQINQKFIYKDTHRFLLFAIHTTYLFVVTIIVVVG